MSRDSPLALRSEPFAMAPTLSHPGCRRLFSTAMGRSAEPYEWQRALAEGDWPEVLIAPTGAGKTAGVTLGWLYRRLVNPDATPARLVWCLPMRTLVDQTAGEIRRWVARLAEDGLNEGGIGRNGSRGQPYPVNSPIPRAEDVHVLMGGVDAGDWLRKPERPSILVGTQDMLLSRALMRGYASSRAIWPMEFALLHRDTQWVFDEVQLMGAGRATSAQLEAFRRGELAEAEAGDRWTDRPCRSMWISATLKPQWLETVDHPAPPGVTRVDPAQERDPRLRALTQAPKKLSRAFEAPASTKAKDEGDYLAELAATVVGTHRTGHMTLVIVNRVKRAQRLYREVRKVLRKARPGPSPELALVHSRFRAADREREMAKIAGPDARADIIVIATQAVEAGVDISAAVMFTELAPWASMVQRFGRANRRAEVEGGARVHWIDFLGLVDGDDTKSRKAAAKLSLPYDADELREARGKLAELKDVAPIHLPPPGDIDPPIRVVRRKDLEDLFDTDADLTGFDVDISPYIRDADDTDIRVFWRGLPGSDDAPPKPRARELCAVPIGMARDWINKTRRTPGPPMLFLRDPQWRRRDGQVAAHPPGWAPLRESPWPGMTVLADVRAGGYDDTTFLGFTGLPGDRPAPVATAESVSGERSGAPTHSPVDESDGHGEDPRSETGRPVRLADHLRHVALEVEGLCDALGLEEDTRKLLVRAAHWHDLGKAHEVFVDTMRRGLDGRGASEEVLLAKTVRRNLRHKRPFFRHELASALAFLAHENWSRDADLAAYLIAAHHGKVRMNLRALPRELPPQDSERAAARFARGIWEGDELPPFDLGGGERWPGGNLTLSVMELGWDENTRESWTERTRDLLARFGPFRLAWLETLLRIADRRASGKEERGEYDEA